MISVGIIGASGFAGVELLRLCAGHPELDVVRATGDTQAGTLVRELYPSLAAVHPDLAFEPYEPGSFQGIDLVFLCLPHGASQAIVPELRERVRWVVDVAADFRLHDAALYPEWYGEAHAAPELLDEFVYGLPELFRKHLEGATPVAVPGCYPTAVDPDAGAAGAGRAGRADRHHRRRRLRGVGRRSAAQAQHHVLRGRRGLHRLRPADPPPHARDRAGGRRGARGWPGAVQVLFTPHLAPMNRGILATCYGRAHGVGSTADVLDCLHDAYDDEPFVVVTDGSPSTKATLGSNVAHLTARYDARTGTVVAIGAIDNLVKGTAGQAIQCVNVLAGLPEATGLPDRRGVPVSRPACGTAARDAEVLAQAHERAGVLIEALPYIRRFFGATVVVKYGGNAMVDPDLADRFAEDIVLLQSVGIRPVVVHGGGPQIGDLMARLGKESEFRDGLRVTDAETLDIARMVLVGKVNREIVSAINVHGPIAVGLSGEDAGLITATERDGDLGFVGDVASVNPAIVERLLAENLIPVVSTIGADLAGRPTTSTPTPWPAPSPRRSAPRRSSTSPTSPACCGDVDDPDSLITRTSAPELRSMIADGVLTGGMIPKIEACLAALDGGVGSAHLLDGRVPHVLLLELFTDAGIGTMITRSIGAGA